mgnify:CR=1 FL=1
MDIDFTGKFAMVTGAGRGIGREVVELLLQCGASVIAVSRTAANLESLKRKHPTVETVCVNLADWTAARAALEPYAARVDLLVNNAAYAECLPLEQVTEEHLDIHWNLNVKAVVNVTQLVIEAMKTRRAGTIVNNSSIAGLFGIASHLAYGASKAALDNITKVLALELGQYNIRGKK